MSENMPIEIEVLVLTYNRAPLISATLESLLAQVRPASRICVLDNGSTDNTKEVVQSFSKRGVELVCRPSNDPKICWAELQAMARGPWTMLFHDDDLLHPNYLRDVSIALSHTPESTVAVSSMRAHQDPENAAWAKVSGNHYVVLTGRQLATNLYAGFPMPFCSAVYRIDVLQRAHLEFETYGKICDRPFVIDAALAGKAVVMLDPYVKYRLHAKQDSTDQASGPFLAEVLGLQSYYRKLLGERLTDPSGRIFLRRNYKNLLREHVRLNQNIAQPMSPEIFWREAIKAEATSKRSLCWGKLYAILTQIPKRLERKIKALIR
jgi:glycosyltransferase involved in cell wall biosynthesis